RARLDRSLALQGGLLEGENPFEPRPLSHGEAGRPPPRNESPYPDTLEGESPLEPSWKSWAGRIW
ncbi:MAG: hypothetical protein ACOCWJ_05330, partial [Verrucomicrobiota bacterium]